MITVVLVDAADEQLREIGEWWVANREACPLMLMEEFDRCLSLLESSPAAGSRFYGSRVPGVRRLVMRRTKHHVYYLYDEPSAIVYVLAVWGAPKVGYPVLLDPLERATSEKP
jgi:plasmid stabilization system protein ParE